MGDVVLTVPVIRNILESNPELQITLVTKKFFAPFFFGIPRINLFFIDNDQQYQGWSAPLKLYRDLKAQGPFDTVVDLQGSALTRFISFLFRRSGTPSFRIDKQQKEKEFLIRTKYLRAIKHATTTYLETFLRAGIKGKIGKAPFIDYSPESFQVARSFFIGKIPGNDYIKIGLSPFAPTQPKIWGLDHFRELITLINAHHKAVFFLFGGGEKEVLMLKELEEYGDNIYLAAGKFTLSEELAMIRQLDLMISMDSSNMHLASLSGVPTISIWGATHPVFGFSALNQPDDYHLQIPASSLKCRPCSVQGEKPCIWPEPRCMEMVQTSEVYKKLVELGVLKTKN